MNLNSAVIAFFCIGLPAISQAQLVQFRNRPSQIDDQTIQTVDCDLDAERTIRQHNQVVHSSKQQLLRKQIRNVRVLKTVQGRATHARIAYSLSSTQVTSEQEQPITAKQPIEGKAYLVARQGDALLITNETGQPVSDEEDKLLRAQLETFGQPNPLAEFLNGKQIRVGESVKVPEDVANQLLGLTGNQGKTDRLSLQLSALQRIQNVDYAVFETTLRSHSDESSVSLLMKGELVIEPSTCRTRSIQLHGPVAISERRGPTQGRFIVSTNGSLKVAVKNEHAATRQTARSNQSQQR